MTSMSLPKDRLRVRVGLTYDLKDDYAQEGLDPETLAELDRPETIDAIETALRHEGFATERIGNARALLAQLVTGKRWDVVFNIAEGLNGVSREAQVPALLDLFSIPYTFSDPMVLSLTLHKAMTKRVIRDLKIPTPEFVVVESEEELEQVGLSYPLFAKPVAEGTGKGITGLSKLESSSGLREVCTQLWEKFRQPVLLERYLPGREFTVGLLGTGKESRVIGVLEVMLGERAEEGAYTYDNKAHYEDRVVYRLATDPMAVRAGEVALAAWRGLGCRDAGRVDLRADEAGMPNFIEVNPLAGLHPVDSDLPILCAKVGMSYQNLIGAIMKSALSRSASAKSPVAGVQRGIP